MIIIIEVFHKKNCMHSIMFCIIEVHYSFFYSKPLIQVLEIYISPRPPSPLYNEAYLNMCDYKPVTRPTYLHFKTSASWTGTVKEGGGRGGGLSWGYRDKFWCFPVFCIANNHPAPLPYIFK